MTPKILLASAIGIAGGLAIGYSIWKMSPLLQRSSQIVLFRKYPEKVLF